jgi:hypothetical protein
MRNLLFVVLFVIGCGTAAEEKFVDSKTVPMNAWVDEFYEKDGEIIATFKGVGKCKMTPKELADRIMESNKQDWMTVAPPSPKKCPCCDDCKCAAPANGRGCDCSYTTLQPCTTKCTCKKKDK